VQTISAGTGVLTFRLRGGTLGTTSDTAIQTFVVPQQVTSGTPTARIEITINMRGSGAAATSYGSMHVSKSVATGWGGSVPTLWIVGTPANVNTTTLTSLHLDLQNSASTPSLLIQTAAIELQV
jgi:hypothetical protein